MRSDPRARLFPPVVPIVTTLAGLLLQRVRPLGLVSRPASYWIGGVLIAAWAVLAALAMREFRRAGTSPIPGREVTALVTGGPFRRTRNPMYVGLVLLQAGVAFALGNAWVLLFVPLSLIALDRIVIAGEERYLEAKYGGEFTAYRSRVRRWI